MVLVNFDSKRIKEYDKTVCALTGIGSYSYAPKKLDLDLKNCPTRSDKPFFEEPSMLELKKILGHLRYMFLDSGNTLPVITVSNLVEQYVKALIFVLRRYKRDIRWMIADIIGISPDICTHKIQLEEECMPTIEHQRRLNPHIQEVVKKEIIKWLDVGVVYPIFDSKWPSLVQCVLKKGGLTVVANENNE